jgi:hypothetical protein
VTGPRAESDAARPVQQAYRRLLEDVSHARRFFWKKFADEIIAGLPRYDLAEKDSAWPILLGWQAQHDVGVARILLAELGVASFHSVIRPPFLAGFSPAVGMLGHRWGPGDPPRPSSSRPPSSRCRARGWT